MIARSRRRVVGIGLLDQALDPVQPAIVEAVAGRLGVDHAVAAGLLVGDLHDRDHRRVGLVVGVDQLADARPVADHDVVGQDHRERLVADELLGHQDGVAQAELLLLAHVGDLGQVADVLDPPEHLDVAALLEQVLELVADIEVVLDRPLLAGGDDDDLLDAGRHRLFDGVLDDRLVDERQHFLRLGLRRRQEPRSPTGGRQDRLSDSHRTSQTWVLGSGSIPPDLLQPGAGTWLGWVGGRARRGRRGLQDDPGGNHQDPTQELDRAEGLAQDHGRQDRPVDRLEHRQDAGPDRSDEPDRDEEQERREARSEEAGDEQVRPGGRAPERLDRACRASRPGRRSR